MNNVKMDSILISYCRRYRYINILINTNENNINNCANNLH